MSNITVIKRNIDRQETWRYQGKIIHQDDKKLVLEAFFDREDSVFHGMQLYRGDRFVETYYRDRWYNIFEIHARDDDRLRGWYCNIAHPAELDGNVLSYIDLALDLLVFPDGRQLVLDENEFNQLPLSPEIRSRAQQALTELQESFLENFNT
jgi:protein associated with RNAse G/E